MSARLGFAALLVAAGLGGAVALWPRQPAPDRSGEAASEPTEAQDPLHRATSAAADGQRVDLRAAVPGAWESVIVFPPYTSAVHRRAVLGTGVEDEPSPNQGVATMDFVRGREGRRDVVRTLRFSGGEMFIPGNDRFLREDPSGAYLVVPRSSGVWRVRRTGRVTLRFTPGR